MTDADLVRQVLAGRTVAYGELANRWAARVTALCHARVGRAAIADELAQETLLRGFRALHTLSDPERVGAWLCGIAVRTALDWLKCRENAQVPFSTLGPRLADLPGREEVSEAFDAQEERDRLLAAVEALPEVYRQVVMLYYYEDSTYRDLACLLQVSAATINARLTKARAILRERLAPCRRETDGRTHVDAAVGLAGRGTVPCRGRGGEQPAANRSAVESRSGGLDVAP